MSQELILYLRILERAILYNISSRAPLGTAHPYRGIIRYYDYLGCPKFPPDYLTCITAPKLLIDFVYKCGFSYNITEDFALYIAWRLSNDLSEYYTNT